MPSIHDSDSPAKRKPTKQGKIAYTRAALDWISELDKDGMTPSMVVILYALASRINSKYQCWPGLDRLAADTGLCRRAVINNREKLIELKLINVKHRQSDNQRDESTLYTLLVPAQYRHGLPSKAKQKVGRNSLEKRGKNPGSRGGGCTRCTPSGGAYGSKWGCTRCTPRGAPDAPEYITTTYQGKISAELATPTGAALPRRSGETPERSGEEPEIEETEQNYPEEVESSAPDFDAEGFDQDMKASKGVVMVSDILPISADYCGTSDKPMSKSQKPAHWHKCMETYFPAHYKAGDLPQKDFDALTNIYSHAPDGGSDYLTAMMIEHTFQNFEALCKGVKYPRPNEIYKRIDKCRHSLIKRLEATVKH